MMITYKSIFKGRLEFGNPKSYDKVLKMYQHRVENYYKMDILLNEEEIFDQEAFTLNVPRFITQGSVKSFKNTVSLLEYVAQFAVSGDIGIWMTEEGKILRHNRVEPKSDRGAVQAYLKGRELSGQEGKEDEAMSALSKAIEKFERHAHAYERRGYVNYMLKNFEDARYDFTKSIDMCSINPDAYFGRAKLKMKEEDYKGAIEDFNNAVKTSIPLQPIYWHARRLKADCHFKLNDYNGALLDLKLFSKRHFSEDNPNYNFKRSVLFNYGRALMETQSFEEAIAVFQRVHETDYGTDSIPEGDKFYYLGMAKKQAGKNGYVKDLKKAAELGSALVPQKVK